MVKTIVFKEPKHIFSDNALDATEYSFPYTMVDTALVGSPEERSETKCNRIKVSISGTLETMWFGRDENLDITKVLFEYGKRHIIQKLKDGTLLEKEELWLTTATHPKSCPFNSDRIPDPNGNKIEVELGDEKLMQNMTLLQLATSIIEIRDNINSVIKERRGDKLFLLREERDLLQFFRDATSTEDWSYRVNALRNAIVNLNESLLRKLTGNNDPQIGTIVLLENFLKTYDNYDEIPIRVFKQINRLRQGYPIHGDTVDGVQEAYRFFGFNYPIINYSESWRQLLLSYLDALQRIFEIIKPLKEK